MLHSLWFRLSVCFTFITFFSSCLINIIAFPIWNFYNYNKIITPQLIYEAVALEEAVLAGAIDNRHSKRWHDLARQSVLKKIMDLKPREEEDILNYCDIEIYFQVFDQNGEKIFSQPETLPKAAADLLDAASLQPLQSRAENIQDYIHLTLPVKNETGRYVGRLEVLFLAKFNIESHLKEELDYYRKYSHIVLALLFVESLMCGLAAYFFVTSCLKKMDQVTAIWRTGDFTPRIEFNHKIKDVLAEHSRRLNSMADDLEALFDLRQQMAVTEERNRVARDLHDTVKQNLFALKLHLAVIRSKNSTPDIDPPLEEAEKITSEAQKDLMEILSKLYLYSGLENSLALLTDDLRRRFQVKFTWRRKMDLKISSEQKRNLLHLAREAVSNAVRHGQSSEIVLDLYQKQGFNYWTIDDNGHGLPESEISSCGLGLVFMKERAAELPEGEFFIGRGRRGGVMITIKWRDESAG